MKKRRRSDTAKEFVKALLRELSVIPVYVLFGLIVLLIGYFLPDWFPFEVLCVLGIIVILGFLYAVAGVVTVMQKIRSRRNQTTQDTDTH